MDRHGVDSRTIARKDARRGRRMSGTNSDVLGRDQETIQVGRFISRVPDGPSGLLLEGEAACTPSGSPGSHPGRGVDRGT